jgi:hypothetical protein
MKWTAKKKVLALLVAIMLGIIPAASASGSDSGSGKVSFADGQYVKLGYSTVTPPVWEVKALPGAGNGSR